jgi:hypothetical protein
LVSSANIGYVAVKPVHKEDNITGAVFLRGIRQNYFSPFTVFMPPNNPVVRVKSL